jgi:hypothetical protein
MTNWTTVIRNYNRERQAKSKAEESGLLHLIEKCKGDHDEKGRHKPRSTADEERR